MIVTPAIIDDYKKHIFPEAVSEIINRLIAAKWDGYSTSFLHKDLVANLKAVDITETSLEYSLALNFRTVYSDAGWKIERDYNCDREIYYIFTKAS